MKSLNNRDTDLIETVLIYTFAAMFIVQTLTAAMFIVQTLTGVSSQLLVTLTNRYKLMIILKITGLAT